MRLPEAIFAILLMASASAAGATESRSLDLPGGRLGDAVVALGRQAGVSVGVSDPLLAGTQVRSVRGLMTAEQALSRLLSGTPARYVALDGRTFRIVRRAAPRRAPAFPRITTPQPPPDAEEEAIIVTATRRPIRLASYAGGADIVSGDRLTPADGARGTGAMVSLLPELAATYRGSGRDKLFIRGIADSSFIGPTQATAGQYLGDTRLNYNAPDPDLRLYDIDRIEILQGPQGTLYGSGSLGGIIRILPNRPDLDRAGGWISGGASATWHGAPGADAAGMANLPLAEGRAGLRLIAYGVEDGGYIDDSARDLDNVNRVRTVGGRVALRAVLTSGWTIDVGATGQRIRSRDSQYADRDTPPLTRASAVAQPFGSDFLLGDLIVSNQWGRLRLVTSFGASHQQLSERYDATQAGGPPAAFAQQTRTSLFSAESRLSWQDDSGSGWIVGTSLISNRAEQRRQSGDGAFLATFNRIDDDFIRAALPAQTGVDNRIEEATLFGEGSLALLPGVIATAGGRLTRSHLSGSALDVFLPVLQPLTGTQASRNETAFLPSAALSIEAAPRLHLFARYQESFRPGGLAVSELAIRRFRNDHVSTLEAGLRYGLPGLRAFDLTATAAYTRWDDIQADTVTMNGFPTTANIGNGRIYTFEMALGWRPLRGLSLAFAGIANDSRVTNPQPNIDMTSDSSLPNVADFSGRIGADYESRIAPGVDLRLSAAARYVGKSRLGIGPVLGERQGDWLDLTAGAEIDRGRHAWFVDVTNLLDTAGNRFALGSPFTLVNGRQVTPMRPRTIRIGWQLRF